MQITQYDSATEITIERVTDIYPLLNWANSELMDKINSGLDVNGEFLEAANKVSKLMDIAESMGLGSMDDVDAVSYIFTRSG